jgi:hypothetical protein
LEIFRKSLHPVFEKFSKNLHFGHFWAVLGHFGGWGLNKTFFEKNEKTSRDAMVSHIHAKFQKLIMNGFVVPEADGQTNGREITSPIF